MDRFWNKIIKYASGCWHWNGCIVRGYGQIRWQGKLIYVHRLSWIIHNGSIPVGMMVCHKCDTPICVNPDHLFLGTAKDNGADKANKHRAARLLGEQNPYAKLTAFQAIQAKAGHANGESCTSIARRFHVDRTTISKIVNGVNWKHLHGIA